MRTLKIFFDGGCRPNPGKMELAVVVRGRAEILRDVGHGTSTDAEWLALIHAARVAAALDTADIVLLGDSANVVAQANGTAPCRGRSILHRVALLAMRPDGKLPRIRHIARTQNLAGIALARLHDR